jgi:hypothetical protein
MQRMQEAVRQILVCTGFTRTQSSAASLLTEITAQVSFPTATTAFRFTLWFL